MVKEFRGRRMHVLDMLGAADYPGQLQKILEPHGVTLTSSDAHRPLGRQDAEEWELPRYCQTNCLKWLSHASGDSIDRARVCRAGAPSYAMPKRVLAQPHSWMRSSARTGRRLP